MVPWFSSSSPTPSPSLTGRGKVKGYATDKGYGFITKEDGEDIFFHRRNLKRGEVEPVKGDIVTFTISQSMQGAEAKFEAIDVAGGTKPGYSSTNTVVGFMRSFNAKKGFGFVTVGNEDIFCHRSEIIDPVVIESLIKHKKCAVEMQIVVSEDKKSGVHIRRVMTENKTASAETDPGTLQSLVAKTVADTIDPIDNRLRELEKQKALKKEDIELMIQATVEPVKNEIKEIGDEVANFKIDIKKDLGEKFQNLAAQHETTSKSVAEVEKKQDEVIKQTELLTKLFQTQSQAQATAQSENQASFMKLQKAMEGNNRGGDGTRRSSISNPPTNSVPGRSSSGGNFRDATPRPPAPVNKTPVSEKATVSSLNRASPSVENLSRKG